MEEEENDCWKLDLPLTKQGNSLAITIPKKVLNAVGYGQGDKVTVILRKKGGEL